MKRVRYRRVLTVAALLLAAILFVAVPYLSGRDSAAAPQDEVLLYVIDVGQGDAALLRTPAGDVLIDTGTNESQEALLSFLEDAGVTALSYVIVSHPHEDHAGGADGVLTALPVAQLLLPEMTSLGQEERQQVAAIAAAAGKSGTKLRMVSAGDSFSLGEVGFEILSPQPGAQPDDANDSSLVVRVTYGAAVMLFMGDATAQVEEQLLAAGEAERLDCDFLKVGHHGSDTSSSAAFLAAATPRLAAISCGAGNVYNHPARQVLDRLAAVGAQCDRTDRQGTLCFRCDGETIYPVE